MVRIVLAVAYSHPDSPIFNPGCLPVTQPSYLEHNAHRNNCHCVLFNTEMMLFTVFKSG